MKNTCEVGEVVVLNSGGPKMTIEEVNIEYMTCAWFDCNDTLVRSDFPREMLLVWNSEL